MKGCIVIPTRRPQQAQWIHFCWSQQKVSIPLIVVLNGDALKSAKSFSFAKVLMGPEHKSECLAIAEEWCSDNGFDWISYWDDDDLYTNEYVSEVSRAFGSGASIVGQSQRYIRTSEGSLWRTLGKNSTIMGGCLSAKVGISSWRNIENANGPEQVWMSRANKKPVILPPGYFCQWRNSKTHNHTWDVSDKHIALVSGGAIDLGSFDYNIVERTKPEPEGRIVETTEEDRWSFVDRLVAREL